ncbi:MAG: hypothetical protein SNJ35_08355 [Rikenellaceae bacterium]
MITKIEIDGKPRIAVVLNEYTSIEDVFDYSNSILTLIQGCFMESENAVSKETIYNSIELVKHLQPSINQNYAMQRAYFKDTETHAPDIATPQQCKMWL